MYYENFIIGLLVFSGIIIGLAYFVADLSSNYDKNYEDISYITNVGKIKDSTDNLADSVMNTKITGVSYIDMPIVLFSGILGTFKLIFIDLSRFVVSLISDISSLLGLPAWFTGIITTIISVMLIFSLIRIFVKTKV